MSTAAPGPAGDLRRPARRGRRARASSTTAAELLDARRATGGSRRRPFEETGAVRARGGGVHRHRPQGDVHLRRPGRPQPDAAAGGDGADLPRLRRARHAQAPAAGEALVLGAVLPLRAPAGGPLPPVQPDRRRGDRHRLAAGRRRADRPARRAPARARDRRRSSCGSAASARPRRAPPTATSCATTCASTRRSSPTRSARGSTPTRCARSTPTTRGPAAVMAGAPTMLDRLDDDDAEHFAAVRRMLDAAGVAYELDGTLVRGPRLLHAHGLRVHLRAARRPVGRSAAAAATTAWSSSSAGPRRRRSAGRPGSSGSCWRSARRRRAGSPTSSWSPPTAARAGPGARDRAAPGRRCAPTSTSPAARSRAR